MENSLLIKNVLHEGRQCNILISGNRFADLDAPADVQAGKVVDATGKAILPPFYNTHNHAAMVLLRGYADDMPLDKWLQDYIWPYEDTLTAADIRRGSELAVKEMIQSGSVFFNDMYFDIEETIDVVNKAGMRACFGITVMEMHSKAVEDAKMDFLKNFRDPSGGRIQLAMAPHAIYTVGTEKLLRTAEVARNAGIPIHIHVAETKKEVDDCLKEHGTTPVRYLDSIGLLGNDVVAAHCVWVDEEEWDILASRGVNVAHCPCSNMKLGSGRFPYELAIRSGCNITLGTDGASSNNNLDMREEMKFAALFAKASGDPQILPAGQVLEWASANGARAFGIDGGRIEKGALADAILIGLDDTFMTPCHNLVSNWVYSANSSCVNTVICDGKIIFQK